MDGNRYLCRFRRKNERSSTSRWEYWFLVESLGAIMFLHKNLESCHKFWERDMEYYHESLMEISDRECISFGEKHGTSSDGGYDICTDRGQTIQQQKTEAESHGIKAEFFEEWWLGDEWGYDEYTQKELCVHIFPVEVFARIREF